MNIMTEPKQKKPKWTLDVLIVVVAAALVVLSGYFGAQAGHAPVKGAGAVLGGTYIIYFGVLFLISYFFPDKTYILNFLRYVCEECSRGSPGRHMAFVYFALGLVLGGWVLLVGLGIF
jgi:hypothetical protein